MLITTKSIEKPTMDMIQMIIIPIISDPVKAITTNPGQIKNKIPIFKIKVTTIATPSIKIIMKTITKNEIIRTINRIFILLKIEIIIIIMKSNKIRIQGMKMILFIKFKTQIRIKILIKIRKGAV